MRMHAWIKLKLGTQNGHICTNFGTNSIKISGVMTNFLHKTR